MKAKELSTKEYEACLKTMRAWLPHQRDEVAKLVWYIEFLREENKRLRKTQQRDLFKSEEPVKVAKQYQPFVPKVSNSQKVPLAKRLKLMIEANETDSAEWKQTLKWNGLTHERALAIATSEEKKEVSKG